MSIFDEEIFLEDMRKISKDFEVEGFEVTENEVDVLRKFASGDITLDNIISGLNEF